MFRLIRMNNFTQARNDGYLQSPKNLIHVNQPGRIDYDYQKINHELIEELKPDDKNRQQADNKSSTAADNSAIMNIQSQLKMLCSLQVHDSKKSPQSSCNNQTHLSSQFNTTCSKSSIELPTEDSLFLQQILDNSQFPATLDDNLFCESFNDFLSENPEMTFKDLTDVPMDDNANYMHDLGMPGNMSPAHHDEVSSSSIESIIEENLRDDINRRGLKKSGGPVRKLARFGNKQVIKYSDEYHDRRVKNNEAVKKSRLKAKDKQKTTEAKMAELANENRTLNDRVDLLLKELQVLKSLYKELNQDLPAAAVKELERVNVH